VFQHQGIWLPDGEKHFPQWMDRHGELVDGKGTYQIKKLRRALEFAPNFRVAVDVGAHVGLWSMQLMKHFTAVHAFEPVTAHAECFAKNVGDPARNVTLHRLALGAVPGRVRMSIDPADSGGTHVDPVAEDGNVSLSRLDSFVFTDVDFIKIDCEGYELQVLQGAEDTLAHCRPCVIVEQKPHKLQMNYGVQGAPAVEFLKALGAKQRAELGGDFIMSWD
jgi:FkbM family methyltransferase